MASRRSVIEFTHRKCGLVKSKNACRCERRLAQALKTGRVESGRLQFAGSNDALHAQRAPRRDSGTEGGSTRCGPLQVRSRFPCTENFPASYSESHVVALTTPRHIHRSQISRGGTLFSKRQPLTGTQRRLRNTDRRFAGTSDSQIRRRGLRGVPLRQGASHHSTR